MSVVTAVGAPSYTSGVQTWNGIIATLNPNPTSRSAMPQIAIGPAFPRSASAISVSRVAPVAP
jgi:hypothetical protein